MAYIKNLKLGTTTYQINATQLEGKSASEYALKTDLSKFDKLALKIVSTLPTAAAATQDAIYLVAHGGHSDSPDSYDEYITVESSGKYSWEKIGNTDVKLDGYLKTTDVIDALNNQSATNPLSANQGYQLNQRLDEVETYGSKLVTVEDDIIGINGSISSLSTRLSTAESNISNRYTKAETDSKLDDEAVKTSNTKDMKYDEIVAMKRSYVGSSNQGPYKALAAGNHENLIRVNSKNFGGDNYVFEMSHDFWENDGIHYRYKAEGEYSSWKTLIDSDSIGSQHVAYADTATSASFANVLKNAPGQYGVAGMNRLSSWDEINAPSWHGIRAQLISSSLQGKTEPDGTIMTFGWDTGHYDTQLLIPGGDSTGKVYNPMMRTQSESSNYGSWHYIPYMEDVDKKIANEITKEALTSVLGFGGYQPTITWGSMTSGYTPVWGADNLHGGGIHFAEKDDHTSMQIDGTFRQREGMYEVIDTSTVADQTVKSFTATEIDHGDKFKGDLESTTKVSAPVIEVTNHLTNSDGNDINLPDKAGTLTTTDDLNNYVAKGSSTSSSTTGITASASAPTFTGTAHGHTINDNGHAHTYSKTTSASAAGWNISVDGSTLIFTSNTSVSLGYTNTATANSKTGISINTTVAGGSVGKPSITISDPGHSHKEN